MSGIVLECDCSDSEDPYLDLNKPIQTSEAIPKKTRKTTKYNQKERKKLETHSNSTLGQLDDLDLCKSFLDYATETPSRLSPEHTPRRVLTIDSDSDVDNQGTYFHPLSPLWVPNSTIESNTNGQQREKPSSTIHDLGDELSFPGYSGKFPSCLEKEPPLEFDITLKASGVIDLTSPKMSSPLGHKDIEKSSPLEKSMDSQLQLLVQRGEVLEFDLTSGVIDIAALKPTEPPKPPKPKKSSRIASLYGSPETSVDPPQQPQQSKPHSKPHPRKPKNKEKENSIPNEGEDAVNLSESALKRQRGQTKKNQPKRKKLRKNKEDAIKEMKIIIDSKLIQEEGGGQLLAMMQETGCKARMKELNIRGSIQWQRMNDEKTPDQEETSDQENSEPIKLLLVRFMGAEFVALVEEGRLLEFCDQAYDYHSREISFIFVIEGLEDYLKELYINAQREYRQEVISRGSNVEDEVPAASHKKKKKSIHITRDQVEDAFLTLQIERKAQVIQTNSRKDTALYIQRLTYALAEKPYRRVPSAFEGFCAEATSRRAARSLEEAWIAQLVQIQSVSKSIAVTITEKYPTVSSLVNIYKSNALTTKEKQELLADLRVKGIGGVTGRRIGPALSEKIYRVFTETDGSTVI